ncbi:MAG TPA: glycosyltransferase [Solirubrobacteraceae bacterium]|nr:glycosyltransferase [Solirubrobacteraceae bacterium]
MKTDMHCHSTASAVSRLGVQRSLGLPECATPPDEVYDLAKKRGMDFVTITDHDTIDGALAIAERHDDAFVSEELTAWFRGEPQAVHVLVYGITPDDHAWLQEHRLDVEACAEYLRGNEIACALAHPFYTVRAPLTPGHRRRLAQLFPVWETRNGARAPELNAPAAIYVETRGGVGIGGSDDHAGVDVGRTWTETPPAATWREFLEHVRGGSAEACGDQGSAAKWAHAAMAIAVRTLGTGEEPALGRSDPSVVLRMVERVMSEGNARAGATGSDLGPDDARSLLRAWLAATGLRMSGDELLAWMQSDAFSHADLFRTARRRHERALGHAVDDVVTLAEHDANPALAAPALFRACVAAIPYAPAAAFLGREKGRLARRDGEPLRVALVADGIGGMHGVTHTLEEIQARGVPGFEVEIVGTDPNVDRRLPAVREVDVPFYAGLRLGVPGLPAIVEALAEGRYDAVHLVSPGPCGVAAAVIARVMELPVLGSYHTELAAYARLRSGDGALGRLATRAVGAFYRGCTHVLSPSPASDAVLHDLGIPPSRIGRWDRGVDVERFAPERRVEGLLRADAVNVLYAGRLTHEKGADLLAEAFLAARERDPRLHLNLAGGGPEEDRLRTRLGEHATFLGWLEGDDLARAYASADVFLFCSRTDTFGQVLLEAQASGLPVVAVAEGGPCSIVTDDVTGLLRPPDARALAQAVCELARMPFQRERLARNALLSVRERTWEAALERLAAGYRACVAPAADGHSSDADVRGGLRPAQLASA